MVRFKKFGKENRKTVYLAERKMNGLWSAFARIWYEDGDWLFRPLNSYRIERFCSLADAKDEALKSAF